MRKILIATIVIIVISFLASFYFYGQMPDQMASHWNSKGEVNGSLGKWSIFLMPVTSLILFLLFLFIIRLDPLKKNIEDFQKDYDLFILVIILFLTYIGALMIVWNLGVHFDAVKAIIPAFAVLLFYVGILLDKSKRNWFIGIRTPWTLSNDTVWRKTNELGGKIFKAFGGVCLIMVLIPEYFGYFMLILIPIIIWIYAYSYFEYNKIVKK